MICNIAIAWCLEKQRHLFSLHVFCLLQTLHIQKNNNKKQQQKTKTTDMKKRFKQRRSTVPPMPTKRTVTSHLNSLTKTTSPLHITLKIQVLAWSRHKSIGGVKPANVQSRMDNLERHE